MATITAGPAPTPAGDAAPAGDDARLVAALRAGDEAAFLALVERYHATLVRMATLYVADRAMAEEVAQETWLCLLQGLDRFEGRSSLRTWLCHILLNRARTRARREERAIPFAALGDPAVAPGEPAVGPARFLPADHPRWPRRWASAPQGWGDAPEERFLAGELRGQLGTAIAALPPGQRAVLTLRDVEGWAAGEVCNVLGISETNQRVLLHRARSRVRRALERYLAAG